MSSSSSSSSPSSSPSSAHDPVAKIVSVSQFVPVTASEIFNLLADPAMHVVIDGSGSVKAPSDDAPQRLSLGATFGMSMRIGVPYRITNTVVEFEEYRRIARHHFGGHIWRYILEPATGGTMVTEQFAYATNRAPLVLKLMRAIPRNEVSMRKTLLNLAAHFAKH